MTTDDHDGLTEAVCEEITSYSCHDHPDTHITYVRQAIIDALGNALLARETPLGRSYLDQVSAADGSFTVIGGDQAGAVDTAFTNAGLINALDWDDTAGGHPGSSVLPAALYAARRTDCTTHELLNGVLIGYEISIRAAKALHPTWERYDVVHGSGTRHALGAAAAIAAIESKDVTQVEEFLGTAAQLAPVPHAGKVGWDSGYVTWLKDNNARATTAAVRAAEFPDQFRGTPGILHGEAGFWRMAGSDRCDWELLGTPIRERYVVAELELKPFPCCRWLHAGVEAANEAAKEVGQPDSLRVETAPRVATKCDLEPTNQVNAQFSFPYVVALAAQNRNPYDWFTPEGPVAMPPLSVDVVGTDEMANHYQTTHHVGAAVTVTDTDGNSATETVKQPLGIRDRPVPYEDSLEKLETGISRVLGDDCANRAEDVANTLGDDVAVSQLFDLLQ